MNAPKDATHYSNPYDILTYWRKMVYRYTDDRTPLSSWYYYEKGMWIKDISACSRNFKLILTDSFKTV